MDVIVVRIANWLGDTVMALPALARLRAVRSRARITVTGRWAPLLAGQGVADVLLPYPRDVRERIAFGRAMALERLDLAIVLPNSFESALSAWWWRAARRIGFDADGRGALLTDRLPLPSPRRHQIDEYLTLMTAAEIDIGDDQVPVWSLPRRPVMQAEADSLLAEAGVPPGSRVVGLHLGAAFGPSKLWPAESYGELATRLDLAGFVPLLLGAPQDVETAETVAKTAASRPPSLVGRDRPALVPWLLTRLACLVSGDTGVAHLAAALGVTTVTLFGPTDPRLTAPRGPRARLLHGAAPCSPCFLATCPIDHRCLKAIDATAVEREIVAAIGR
jgi:heptosyltransferase-2